MQSVGSEEDGPFPKKESLDQLQQFNKNFFADDFNSDDLLMVDDDITVMEGMIMKKEFLQEICETETGNEEEDEENGDKEMKLQNKKTQQQIHQAIETLVDFSTFTESRETGAIALKVSYLIEIEINGSMRQVTIVDFFKKQ